MTQNQIQFLNDSCDSITIGSGENYSSSRNTITVNDFSSLLVLLENLKDVNKIKNITFNVGIKLDIEAISKFKGLQKLDVSSGNLDLETLYKIYEAFKDIKQLNFPTMDEKVIEVCDKFDFKIVCYDSKLTLQTDNPYLLGKNRLTAKKIESLTIGLPVSYDHLEELIKYGSFIGNLSFYSNDFDEVARIVEYLQSGGLKLENVSIGFENKKYDHLGALERLEKNTNLIVCFDRYRGHPVPSTLDDFKETRAALDYWASLINAVDLSPAEKVMYAYDLVKSFVYTKNKAEAAGDKSQNKTESRTVGSIIRTGSIVCYGYDQLLIQLLSEVGIKAETAYVNALQSRSKSPEDFELIDPDSLNHARTQVMIDDEKYNINGIFTLDATWDRAQEEKNGFDGYEFFLTPPSKYNEVFPDDSYPKLYTYAWGMATKDAIKLKRMRENPEAFERCELVSTLQKFFGTLNADAMLDEYLMTDGLTKEQFISILATVRQAQGYKDETLNSEIARITKMYNFDQEVDQGMSKAA